MRLLVVLVVLAVVVIARRVYFQWRRGLAADDRPVPRLPAEILGGVGGTFVVFTTPWCASCEPITVDLRAARPDARVITVDATDRPDLADAFRVRTAPTVLVADDSGAVQARLVGADAVRDYVRRPAERA